jgi:hypothetical protein
MLAWAASECEQRALQTLRKHTAVREFVITCAIADGAGFILNDHLTQPLEHRWREIDGDEWVTLELGPDLGLGSNLGRISEGVYVVSGLRCLVCTYNYHGATVRLRLPLTKDVDVVVQMQDIADLVRSDEHLLFKDAGVGCLNV